MARRKQEVGKLSASGRQINFRASEDLYARLEAAAEGLNLDVSNLIRMVLVEHLSPYELRAEQARKARPSSEGP